VTNVLTMAVRQAFDHPDPLPRVEAVKTAVCRFLESTDPAIEVRKTEYFNHTVAPDLVLSWPRENRDRQVFLRLNPDPQWLADDLRWIASAEPIMVALDEANGDERRFVATAPLGVAARAGNTLVADTAALEHMSTGEGPGSGLLPHAVLRGGRGALDAGAARRAASVASDGFGAAQRLVEQPTRAAAELFEEMLQPAEARRATRVLQAVWEGHGGSQTSFPAHTSYEGPLGAEDLELLLETVDTGDADFWRRIGRGLTLQLVASLHADDPSVNLQRLVAANVDRLAARAVRVLTEPPRLGEPERLRWLVARGCLALRSAGWAAYFAADSPGLPEAQPRRGVDLGTVRDRTYRRGLTVEAVEVERPDLAIAFRSMVHASVMDLDDIADLEARGSTTVRSASVPLATTRQLQCDFTTTTTRTQTKATATVAELGTVGLGLLIDFDDLAWAAVRALLTQAPTSDGNEQPILDGLDLLE
jgi:hypothetical protein